MLTSNSKVIFSSQNTDTEFIACLTHWLLVAGMQAKSQHRKFSFNVIDLVDEQDEKYGKRIDKRLFLLFANILRETPASIYLFKVAIETVEKVLKYIQVTNEVIVVIPVSLF